MVRSTRHERVPSSTRIEPPLSWGPVPRGAVIG